MSEIQVLRLSKPTEAEIDCAVKLSVIAFESSLLMRAATDGDPVLVDSIFRLQLNACAAAGHIYIATLSGSDEMVGVAAWSPPGIAPLAKEEQRKASGFYELISNLPPPLHKWWKETFLPVSTALSAMAIDAWHLQHLAVDPEHHRKGIAKMLIEPVQKIAADDGLGLALETNREINTVIYKRMGFEIKEAVSLTSVYGDITMYAMATKADKQ